ncbi:MAG: hypothetical protein ACQCN4_06755 [Candidatus Bathyarchaeia archaeon]|jgi:hypothetical protein
MILTASVVVMVLVAMTYASGILNLKIAENEFSGNKQFMSTTGQQLDDIAWTIGRTQTITYTSKFGTLKYEPDVLSYTVAIHTPAGWTTNSYTTGIVLYNMPISSYEMGGNYFERVPQTANSSIVQYGSSAPVSQVFCEEKLSMSDGNYVRIALVPTVRVLSSSVTGNYLKFYLPIMHNGTIAYLSQTLTLTGEGIVKTKLNSVDRVDITVSYPKADLGFDSSFFRFASSSVTLNSASTPSLPASGSIVEVYTGEVQVSIGAV